MKDVNDEKEWRKAKDDATVVEYEPSKYSRDQVVHIGPGSRGLFW